MTGGQVTISSRSAKEPSCRRLGFQKILIQTEVSTRTTRFLAGRDIAPHLREIPLPKAAPRELEDAPCPAAPQIIFDGSGHGARVGPLSTHAGDLFEELLVQHKVRAFHLHRLLQTRVPDAPRLLRSHLPFLGSDFRPPTLPTEESALFQPSH